MSINNTSFYEYMRQLNLSIEFNPLKLSNLNAEPVVWRCSLKKVLFNLLQNSKVNICARVSFLIKLQASKFRLQHSCFPLNFEKF